MSERKKQKNLQLLGVFGLILFVFGLLLLSLQGAFLVVPGSSWLIPLHLIGGGLALAFFILRGGMALLRTAAARRVSSFSFGLLFYTALFLSVLGVLNYIGYRYDVFHYDSTEEKVFTLSDQTTKILAALEQPVIARAFFLKNELEPDTKDLLDRMARESKNFQWILIDPERSPELVEKFGIIESTTIHFSFQDATVERESRVSRTLDEQNIVNALMKLTRGGARTVYVLQGHGEGSVGDDSEAGFLFLKESILGENLEVRPITLSSGESIPDDVATLLVIAPKKDFLPIELIALKEYLGRGGSMVLLHEPRNTESLIKFIEPFGINIGKNVVIDQVVRLFEGPGLGVQPVVNAYGEHPVTRAFGKSTVFSIASSVSAGSSRYKDATLTELAFTGASSWGESDIEALFGESPKAELGADDVRGPVSIAAAFEGFVGEQITEDEKEPTKARIVVFGDSDFVSNLNVRQLYNRDLFLNALNWVVGEESAISLRPKTLRQSLRGLTQEQFNFLFLLTGIILPEIVLVFGFSIWWMRRE